jgi:hypothetical protein
MPAARPASLPTSAAAASSIRAASPPFPSGRRGRRAGCRPGCADRLADLAHLLHQRGEPPVLGHLPLGFVQLRPRFQVHVHRLAAHPAGQVPLRPVAAVTGLRARAVRLAALAPHLVQRAPPEVPDLRDQGEQLSAAALQPGQVTAGEVTHRYLHRLNYNITQTSLATCTNQARSQFSRAPSCPWVARGDAAGTADLWGICGNSLPAPQNDPSTSRRACHPAAPRRSVVRRPGSAHRMPPGR